MARRRPSPAAAIARRPRPSLPVAWGMAPAPDVLAWARETFIDEGSILENPEHAHLRLTAIGFLWTDVPMRRRGRALAGMAEMPEEMRGNKWQTVRAERQLREWFGFLPTFLITLDAEYSAEASDAAFCALVEHELLHCGQARDEYGAPKFSRQTGAPIFAMRGHDFEEFLGVVQRYGIHETNLSPLAKLIAAGPTIAPAQLQAACGVCARAA